MSRKEFGILTVDDEERRTSQWLLWSTVLTLSAALAWAATFELDEVTRGQGKVIPVSREQVVQSLDSGVVRQILVREGAVVKKDDVLIRLDDARSGPVFREANGVGFLDFERDDVAHSATFQNSQKRARPKLK